MFKNKKRKGFTIVEVLIVVIIIGILAALVVPRMLDATKTARENTAKAQHRTVLGQINVEIASSPTITEGDMWTQLGKAFPNGWDGSAHTLTKGEGTNKIVSTVTYDNTNKKFSVVTVLNGTALSPALDDSITLP